MINKMIKTKTIATIGNSIETADITTAVVVSTVETTGFATPPVVAVDANLVAPEVPATAAAVPPPDPREVTTHAPGVDPAHNRSPAIHDG